MRRFMITDIVEGNGQPHPTFTRDATYPVLEVLWQTSGNLPGFLVAAVLAVQEGELRGRGGGELAHARMSSGTNSPPQADRPRLPHRA